MTDLEKKEEEQILREIEESFCVAGYDVLEITVKEIEKKKLA